MRYALVEKMYICYILAVIDCSLDRYRIHVVGIPRREILNHSYEQLSLRPVHKGRQSPVELSYKLSTRNNRVRKSSKTIPLSTKPLFDGFTYSCSKILQNQFELLALHVKAFLLPSDPNRVPSCKPLTCCRQRVYRIPSSLFAPQHNVAVY